MLIDFKAGNFKSFRNGFDFSMLSNNRLGDLRYSILEERIGRRNIKALSSSVIYGPNAAGKSTLVNAMSCLKEIVLRGDVEDETTVHSSDRVSNHMSTIPYAYDGNDDPIDFDITFTTDGLLIRYQLSFVIGAFLRESSGRVITFEALSVNGSPVFTRTAGAVERLDLRPIASHLNNGVDTDSAQSILSSMCSNVETDTLTLVTDFHSFCSKSIVSAIKDWFLKRFVVINRFETRFLPEDSMYIRTEDGSDGPQVARDSAMVRIAMEAGVFGDGYIYLKKEHEGRPQLLSIFRLPDGKTTVGIDSASIESRGTLRLIHIMPAILCALRDGSTLVVDEFDTSLHPAIVMNIVSLFHNDDVNRKRAQLIFTTHNPIFLSRGLFRRDEIRFVDHVGDSHESELYSLADFQANGKESVRSTTDYIKNYFVSRYGAIKTVDFTDIVKKALWENNVNVEETERT